MEIMEKELTNTLDNNFNSINISKEQNSFLESTWGKLINGAIDIGLRAILPDLIESQIIEIKDAIISNGFKEGINSAIKSATDLGKSALGIFTGKFENVSQIQTAVKSGGIIDTVSDLVDWSLNKAQKNNLINSGTVNLIKQGKNVILSNVEKNIEENLTEQLKSVEKINKYSDNWKNYFHEKDFENMEKEFKKIEKEIKKTIPIENIINNARKIENIQDLLKNNGYNFDLSENEIKLAEKLV